MALPEHNPIDFTWFARGAPIDHLGTKSFPCGGCQKDTTQEFFKIIAGSHVGFGAPFFVKPFTKKSSTVGKVGGVRGLVSQCTVCDSLWPADLDGSAALMKMGLPHDGILNPNFAYDAETRSAEQQETDGVWDPSAPPQTKIRKSRD